MARKANEVVIHAPPALNEDAIRQDLDGLNTLALATQQHDAAVRAVALRMGYQLPADCTDPDLIQRDIAANMRRSVEACLEVGRGLAVLKQACDHGAFIARLDVLGIDRKVSAKFMQAAAKFSNVSSTRHLTQALGNQTKLFEMLVLDDEQIEELELTGQTGELSLDDVATMSVKELRAALRELRDQAGAKDRLLADKNAKIDELSTSTSRKPVVSHWDEKVGAFKTEIAACFDLIDVTIGRLHLIHSGILNEEVKWGDSAEAEHLILRQFSTLFGDHLNRSAQQVAELCDKYEATLAGWAGELEGRSVFDHAPAPADADAADAAEA